MADTDNEQKTEQATERHLQDAMEHGRFARAPELTVSIGFAAAMLVISFGGQASAERLARYYVTTFATCASTPVRSDTIAAILEEVIYVAAWTVLPILLVCVGAAIIGGGVQSGFRFTPKVLGLNWERLDIAAGFSRIMSARSLVQTGIDILKLAAIGTALYLGSKTLIHDPIFTSPVDTAYLGRFMYSSTTAFMTRIAVSLFIIASIHYLYERFKMSKELMMSRQEVKDERKSSEGDGMLKGTRRRLARRLLQRQMLQAVPTADVVITNPTHYAVALKYERGKDSAPVVLAKGENRFALRIKEIAAENGVPTVEDRPVARMLFAMGKVGEAIPPELYQAVAQILAVVYRTNRYYFHRLKSRRLELAG